MRLIAALLVIYGHSFAITKPGSGLDLFTRLVGWGFSGNLAVDIFFVISGFLVTASVMKAGHLRYLAGRALRIYPGLMLCTLLTVVALGSVLTKSPGYWSSPQTWLYLIHNATAYRAEYALPGVFENHWDTAVNGPLWSLVIEVRLYLIVFVLHLAGILKWRSVFNIGAMLVLSVGYLAPNLIPFGNSPTGLHVSAMFLLGMLGWMNRDRLILNELILLGLLCFAGATQGTGKVVIGYSLLVAHAVFMAAFLPGFTWFKIFGDYSYGVYLYGWIVQQCVLDLDRNMLAWKNALISCVVALALGVLSWHLWERPMLALKDKFRR